jgi:X-Pro dipeptidyl-peptidase
VIDADMAGTNTSTGCPSTGGPADVEGIKAVVEWINGKGTAYTTRLGNETVSADWSTGDSALIGVSYVGTLPIGVAVTGVEGLKTIVPIAAISSWYNYFRANGTVKSGYFDPLAGAVLTRDDYR